MDLIDRVGLYIGIDRDTVLAWARISPFRYKLYYVPKRCGPGLREIRHPSKTTKALQYALLDLLLKDLPIHDAATAYRRGLASPLLATAKQHCGYLFGVRVDLRDFFGSIKPDDLLTRLAPRSDLAEVRATRQFLTNALFAAVQGQGLRLAIGAPSSPIISNVVMHHIDSELTVAAAKLGGVYTRYSDDLLFSTNTKDNCRAFCRVVEAALSHCSSPQLTVNQAKTLLMSRGTRRMAVGLVLTPTAEVSIGRARKRRMRGQVFRASQGKGSPDELRQLQGWLSFANDVEPAFINALCNKYGAQIVKQLSRRLPHDGAKR